MDGLCENGLCEEVGEGGVRGKYTHFALLPGVSASADSSVESHSHISRPNIVAYSIPRVWGFHPFIP